MAYSDYGGYAYRNGERVDDRSDATITPDGDTYGTPGSYPGFALLAAGVPASPPSRPISCIVDELIDASVRLEMAQRAQSIQIGIHRVERLEVELSAALAERDGLMCKALEALDYCIEDSAELLNERTVQWGEFRKDRQAVMAATLKKHRAVAARLRRVLNGA